ncbi:sigma-54 interaction domain-containing protein [Peptostreptococcus faecalis]|uniref:sigma-54 interaction domain-containing protein n=1 Tax=Peptostreptococcus faecalis TaxID=2045015 RepID=UPI000C7CA536|nr:sigma 54-interacting transcriptional regulator [Peptostreptococcus faecalis]
MDINMLESIIINIDTPAFISNENEEIVCKNYHVKYVFQHLDMDEISNANQLELNVINVENNDIKQFEIGDTSLTGFWYNVVLDDGSRCNLYIFDRTFTSDRQISNVMEHIDEVIVIFDEKGVIRRMNAICDQILPFKRKDVIGKNINQLVEEKKVSDPIITKMINAKKKVYKEITYPNGKVISYTAIPITRANGTLKGGVLTGRDVSRLINLAKLSGGMNKDDAKEEEVEYISVSEKIDKIKKIITRVAPSDAPVFIIGESGVGKEIIARSVWSNSYRKKNTFVAINCASIPSDLIESELFGYEKGAFTGANKEGKKGLIEAADGGTLFLDEIGELPLETQKKLLRVIQENAIMRIGGIKTKKVNVRYICATNKTVEELKNPRIFRQDLYYRLNVIPLLIPPLRERKEDILPIVYYYINLFNERYNRNIQLSEEAEKLLLENEWKGNIRELKNMVERLVILSAQEMIFHEQLERTLTLGKENNVSTIGDENNLGNTEPSEKIKVEGIMNIDEAHKIVEQEIIKAAIKKYGNVTKAAQAVGINPSTIYRKIKNGHIKI